MIRTQAFLIATVLCWSAATAPALAQLRGDATPPPVPAAGDGFFFGGGTEAGVGWITVSGDSRSGLSLGLNVQAGLWREGSRRWILEGALHPTTTENPVRAEEFRAVDLLVRYEVGSDFFLAPGLGVQTRWWSGDDPAEDWDIGPVASLSAGTYVDTGPSWVLIPELFADLSLVEVDGDVTAGRAGVRLNLVHVGPS